MGQNVGFYRNILVEDVLEDGQHVVCASNLEKA